MWNQYTEAMHKAKADYWVEWLEGLDVSNVWTVGKIVLSPAMDASNSRIPTLCTKDPVTKCITISANTNNSKSKIFYEMFFPPTNPHLLPPETDFQYPLPRWTFTNISNDQIQLAITRLKLYKASKHSSIPNSVLIQNSKILVPHLGPLFRATNTMEYYPKDWAITDTLVLKKPGEPDYTVLSAWWPIVLSDGLGQLLNSCQAMDLVNMCEKFNILPANHSGRG